MALLNRDGVEIYYEVHGQGPAILLTHGFSATAQMWLPQLDTLAGNHTVITWDMRGHGQSAAPNDPNAYSESITTADMAALLAQVGVRSAIIGGLSLGGYMSLAFNLDYPEMVNALLIIDTGPGFKNDSARAGWNKYARKMADDIEEKGLGAFEDRSAEQMQAVHANLSGVVQAGRHMLTQSSPRVIASLPGISVPCLVVVGANDEPFLAASDYMAAKIPGAAKGVIPDAGHAANIDQPDVFNEAIINFISGLDAC